MKRSGQLVFLGAVVLALTLYGLTAPEGLPWNNSTHLSLAYLGEIVRFPVMPHRIWGCYVQVFGGAVALSAVMAALAAGLIGVLVKRYVGWRFGVSAAVVWMFLPFVWDRAITGERSICLVAMAVVAVWVLEGVVRFVLRVVRERRGEELAEDEEENPSRLKLIVGWVSMGAAGIFAINSLMVHDYRLGEAASVFAKGIVEAAGERIIVMNGVCDDQIVKNAKVKSQGQQRDLSALSLRNDDASRAVIASWVRSAFPSETNLWVAAQVSAEALVMEAARRHPDRFYVMTGKDSTLEDWEKRWEAFKPYLKSKDSFVAVARRMFGYEGNLVANALCDGEEKGQESEVRQRTAYALYKRIYDEIDPGNISALVNTSEMIRRGYVVSGAEEKNVQEELRKYFKNLSQWKYAREILRASGPVRADSSEVEKIVAEAKSQIAAKIADGEKVDYSPEILSLVEWNNEMLQLMDQGEIVKAGRVARAILSRPEWQGSVPANAVMGSVAANEGDYVSSEAFFKAVADTTNVVPAVVLNDYADTLAQLGKLEEAERLARRAVNESDETLWVARLTLVQILEKKMKKKKIEEDETIDEVDLAEFAVGGGAGSTSTPIQKSVVPRNATTLEITNLLKSILSHAPARVRNFIRKEYWGYVR